MAALQGKVRNAPRRFSFDSDYEIHPAHYVFKYPAKFHVPIAAQLIRDFTSAGDVVLDPFCGSGTTLLESSLHGRTSIGVDIDPLAVFISNAKTMRWKASALQNAWTRLHAEFDSLRRPDSEYVRMQHRDISNRTLASTLDAEGLWTPDIPNIQHWFRRYVLLDLARIISRISHRTGVERTFFQLCFASMIRAASNADPVPVSGLEVTAHMLKLDSQGRVIDPFALFSKAVERCLAAVTSEPRGKSQSKVLHADSTDLSAVKVGRVDAVITSPPYQGAVDYYRRHKLETMWLGLATTLEERKKLIPKYIGRLSVSQKHPFVAESTTPNSLIARKLEDLIRTSDNSRANAFRHYVMAMQSCLDSLSQVLSPGRPAVIVVGKSKWKGEELPTNKIMTELAGQHFKLVEQCWYPIKNRYMSFQRHNGPGIDREQVLILERKAA